MVRMAFRLRWLPRHVLLVILVVAFSFLGHWQWDVSATRGDLRNLLYAFQWWFLACMVIYGWWRLLRDAAHPGERAAAAAAAAAAVRRPVFGAAAPAAVPPVGAFADEDPVADDRGPRAWPAAPTRVSTSDLIDAQLASADTETRDGETDEDLARYNEYLARLNARSRALR